jgi:hypothetical protein
MGNNETFVNNEIFMLGNNQQKLDVTSSLAYTNNNIQITHPIKR